MTRAILIAVLGAAVAVAGCGERRAPGSRIDTFAAALPPGFASGPVAGTAHCSLDSVNRVSPRAGAETAVVPAGGGISLSGWMAPDDGRFDDPSLVVRLTAEGRSFHALTTKRAARPDVSAAVGVDAVAPVAFELDARIDAVPAGEYTVSLLARSGSGIVECAVKPRLRVG